MKKLIASIFAFTPVLAFAQQLNNINDVTNRALSLSRLFVYLVISFAVIYIIFNIVRLLIAGGEEERKAGKTGLIYGIVGLFLIFSVWGLVNLLRNSFTFSEGNRDINSEVNRLLPNTAPHI